MQLATQSEVEALPTRWAAKLILRMQALYGAAFTRQWEGLDPDSMAQCWAEELAGYSAEEIRRGLDGCRTSKFPPTLPEFLTMCRPPIQPEVAFHEAVSGMVARRRGEIGSWSHPAIYWAAVRVGNTDMLGMGYGALRARWEGALREMLAAGRWAPIPQPALALPAPGSGLTDRAEASARLAELGASGLLAKRGTPKAWTQRILERDASDRRPATAVVAMAQAALAKATA